MVCGIERVTSVMVGSVTEVGLGSGRGGVGHLTLSWQLESMALLLHTCGSI